MALQFRGLLAIGFAELASAWPAPAWRARPKTRICGEPAFLLLADALGITDPIAIAVHR